MTEASERDQNARPFVDLFPKRQTVAKHLSKVHLEVGGRDNGVMHRNELFSLAVQEKGTSHYKEEIDQCICTPSY